ncbi:hypothetical protein B0G76_4193 [Paraburkholderia sp. BL23I1N1]|uniref:hypothetical protein n=1 Tax=Paraburkholderia sp. BL23I1N1 TaxID=1938802 RepID=UPI000FF6102E|nr:hypothetical protein [Paraburkholderia sp. BL23I1N1]RKE37911.1 hypothetical protein B0G76_4193 [Paraburkholderia sp. BL23I1N1]
MSIERSVKRPLWLGAGLAVAARGWPNRSPLAGEMRLPRDSVAVLAQPVGHFDVANPEESN